MPRSLADNGPNPLSRLSFPDLAHEYKKRRRTASRSRSPLSLFPDDFALGSLSRELARLSAQLVGALVVPERLVRVDRVLYGR